MVTIAVLGAGSWGTALAHVQAQLGHHVVLWDHNAELLVQISSKHENHIYHPGVPLSKNITTKSTLNEAVKDADLIILAIPSYSIRDHLPKLLPLLKKNSILVCAAKGIEVDTLETISSIVAEVWGKKETEQRFTVLSGPSFAHEVIRGTPTAVTVAAFNPETAKKVQEICHTDNFRILTSNDVIGVELAGALKNVIAIAAGAVDGMGFGLNARAALITRGLAEMARIGEKLGANPMTFAGLSGMGDLILTCTGDLSRNRRVGLKLAQGKSMKEVMKEVGQVAEGIRTAKAAYQLAKSLSVDAPILEEIYLALHEGKLPQQAIKDLLARAPEHETH